jgi:hypothetical protein
LIANHGFEISPGNFGQHWRGQNKVVAANQRHVSFDAASQRFDRTALVLLSSADAILATIDDNCLPGDKCRSIAGQKKYCTCHIRRFSQPLDRLLPKQQTRGSSARAYR